MKLLSCVIQVLCCNGVSCHVSLSYVKSHLMSVSVGRYDIFSFVNMP
jgi:hypothetical protein